jgi:hypothetical protein
MDSIAMACSWWDILKWFNLINVGYIWIRIKYVKLAQSGMDWWLYNKVVVIPKWC